MIALSRIWYRLGKVVWVGALGAILSVTVVLAPPALAATANTAIRGVRERLAAKV